MSKRPWYRPSRAFILTFSAIALFIFSACMWGFQTANYLMYRHRAKKMPILNYRPINLPNIEISKNQGTALVHEGLSFEVPWTGLNRNKSKIVGKWAIYSFDSGAVITLCPPSDGGEDLRDVVAKESGVNRHQLAIAFRVGPDDTNYGFHRALLNATPADLSPWMESGQSISFGLVLMIKAISSVGGDTGLFSVSSNDWKGFQFDDPARAPRRITLELYDKNDKHVEVLIAHQPDMKNLPTQADVNRIVQTLRWTDAANTLTADASMKSVASH